MKFEFGQFSEEHLRNIKKGIILYNQELYWECHEDLEDHWLEAQGDPARLIYWAVIQAAAALFHYDNGKLPGAAGMLKKTKNKLERAEAQRVETPLLETYLNWSQFKKVIQSIPDDGGLEDFDKLYEFKFPDPEKWELE